MYIKLFLLTEIFQYDKVYQIISTGYNQNNSIYTIIAKLLKNLHSQNALPEVEIIHSVYFRIVL